MKVDAEMGEMYLQVQECQVLPAVNRRMSLEAGRGNYPLDLDSGHSAFRTGRAKIPAG